MPHRWSDAAIIRRKQIETGLDLTFNKVFKPIIIESIENLSPSSILECGAGTGHLSKELAGRGYKITAVEPSKGMFEVAAEVLSKSDVELINKKCCELPESQQFDVVFSHLVVQTIEELLEHFLSIALNLGAGGHFIFSIPHPCFFNDYKKLFTDDYNYMSTISKEISFKITKDDQNTITEVPYIHRPLSTYINILSQAGFAIIHLNEIYPDREIQKMYGTLWDSPRYILFTCKTL